jgi:hypothetical protein
MGKAGSLVAFTTGRSEHYAATCALRWVPATWGLTTLSTPWGVAITAGPDILREGNLVFMGAAVSDPWGVPGTPLNGLQVLRRFARYGTSASQLAAGPFALADLDSGILVPALNSIVPVFSGVGTHGAVGTHPQIVSDLCEGASPRRVPPGSCTSIDGAHINGHPPDVAEALPLVALAGLDREVAHHIKRGGRRQHQLWSHRIWSDHALHARRVRGAIVAQPRLAHLADSQNPIDDLALIRSRVDDLWWRAGLRNLHLFVPAFERPSYDTMMLALGKSAVESPRRRRPAT